MKKIFETLKSRKGCCGLAIFVAFLIIVIICQYMDRLNLQKDNENWQKIAEEEQTEKKQLQADKEDLQEEKEQFQGDNGILQAYSEELELANGRAQKAISELRKSNKKYKKTLKAIEKSIDVIEVEKGRKLDDGRMTVWSTDDGYIYPHHYATEAKARAHPNLLYTKEKMKSEVAFRFYDLFIYSGEYIVTSPSGKKQYMKDVPYTSGGGPAIFEISLNERGIYLVDLNYEDIRHEYFALLW